MISVVIPLYNKESLVGDTIKSVLNQTFQDFEIVVVDDGSTDNSVSEVEKINDPRIRLVRQQNAGVSAARNRGIEEAKGEYIAFLDADDQWDKYYLETQENMIERFPECSLFATNYYFKDDDGSIRYPILHNLRIDGEDGIMDNYFEIASNSTPPIWTSAVVIRKTAFRIIGGFPEGIKLGEDLLVWAKLACEFKIAYCKKYLATYYFATKALAGAPIKRPDPIDVVGTELSKLSLRYDKPYLNNYIARWHKIRMTTFVPFGMRKEAKGEYHKIQSYVKPDLKTRVWAILNYLPLPLVKWIIRKQKLFVK